MSSLAKPRPYMKRIWILLACVFDIVTVFIVIVSLSGGDPTAPRFVPGAPAALPAFTWDHYDWGGDAPF